MILRMGLDPEIFYLFTVRSWPFGCCIPYGYQLNHGPILCRYSIDPSAPPLNKVCRCAEAFAASQSLFIMSDDAVEVIVVGESDLAYLENKFVAISTLNSEIKSGRALIPKFE